MEAIFLLGLSLLACPQEDEKQLERGREYLKSIGRRLEKTLPLHRRYGIYLGRKWIGHFEMSIRRPDKGNESAFIMTGWATMSVLGRRFITGVRNLYSTEMEVQSSVRLEQHFGTDPKTKVLQLTVRDGKWRQRMETNGKATESEGKAARALSSSVGTLFLMFPPNGGDLQIDSVGKKAIRVRAVQTQEKRTLVIGKRKIAASAIQIRDDDGKSIQLWVDEKGNFVEQTLEKAYRFRRVSPDQFGKDLQEPLPASDPERVIIDMYLALGRADTKAMTALFDFQQFAERSVEGYADMSPDQKKKAVQDFRKGILLGMKRESDEDPTFREDQDELRELFAALCESRVKGDQAKVFISSSIFSLYKAARGPRKGKWLIYNIQSGN